MKEQGLQFIVDGEKVSEEGNTLTPLCALDSRQGN